MENYKRKIINSFSIKSSTYDKYSIVQKEVTKRLLERIKLLKIKPSNVLDIGSGTGHLMQKMFSNFSDSNLVCLDISKEMLKVSKEKNTKFNLICGDAEELPLKEESFDLIMTSFTLQWCNDLKKIFSDIKKLLTKNGVFIFSTVGPDTLFELRESFERIDNFQHINNFKDMHLYGDLLISLDYVDPVLDVERIVIQYESFTELLKSLKCTGSNIVLSKKDNTLSQSEIINLEKEYTKFKKDNFYPATYEVIYGIAWKKI